MKVKTNEEMNTIIQRVMQRADFAFGQKQRRTRKRTQNRNKKRSKARSEIRTRTRAVTKMKNEGFQIMKTATNEIDEMDQNATNG